MAKAFTDRDAERLDHAAQVALADLSPAGFGLGIVAEGRLAYAKGFGFADIESGKPQAPELRQRIGSITKTMVGLSAMALVDEGRLRLDDKVPRLLPEIAFHGDGEAVTVRHLMTHTSGIGEVAMKEDEKAQTETLWSKSPDQDVLGLFPRGVTLDVPVDVKWSYANLGFAMLGEIVARAEGEPIAEVLRRRIFAPLGMADSDLLDLPHPDLTTGYHRAPGEDERDLAKRAGVEIPDEPTVDGVNIRGEYLHIRGGGAAGAVQSTVVDMAKYALALLNNGGGIVRPDTFRAMVASQWAPDPMLSSWGLTFARENHFGRAMFGHNGGVLGGWNSVLIVSPEDQMAMILHVNTAFDGLGKLSGRLLAAALDAGPPVVPTRSTPADVLASAPGVYEALPGELTNFRIRSGIGRTQITAVDDGLVLRSRRGPWKRGVALRPTGEADLFLLDDDDLEPTALRLVRGADGGVIGLRYGLIAMNRAEGAKGWA